jgi:ABC-type transport system involved in cytochrome c biogenesis ATPase subunit
MKTSLIFYKYAFRFQDKLLFYNLNCTLFPGTLFFIKGGNGAGKSTFFRCILGPLKQSSGQLLGLPVKCSIAKQALFLPVVHYTAYKTLSVLDNLKFWHLLLYRATSLDYILITKLLYLYSFFFRKLLGSL